MESIERFPDWDKIVEYVDGNEEEVLLKVQETDSTQVNYEDLLNIETYQLWKLLKKM